MVLASSSLLPAGSSCQYRLESTTTTTTITTVTSPGCPCVAVLQYTGPAGPHCLQVSVMVSTAGGRSDWSLARRVTSRPSVPSVTSVSLTENYKNQVTSLAGPADQLTLLYQSVTASLHFTSDDSDGCQWKILETSEVIRGPGDLPASSCLSCCLQEKSATGTLPPHQCQDLTANVRCRNKFPMDNVIPLLPLRVVLIKSHHRKLSSWSSKS